MKCTKITVLWGYDSDTDIMTHMDRPIYERNTTDRNRSLQVDIPNTLGSHLQDLRDWNTREGLGHSEEYLKAEARSYTAQDLEIFGSWARDEWTYLGCTVTGYYLEDGEEDEDLANGIPESLWGIESNCGTEYKKEIEQELLTTIVNYLKTLGITKFPESEELEDSCHISEPDSEKVDPLPDTGEFFHLESRGVDKIVLVCFYCDSECEEDISQEAVLAGRCPNSQCYRYHHQICKVLREDPLFSDLSPEENLLCILQHPVGYTEEGPGNWEERLKNAYEKLEQSVVQHRSLIDYLIQGTDSVVIPEMPTYIPHWSYRKTPIEVDSIEVGLEKVIQNA